MASQVPPLQPGQQPTPQQLQMMQQQFMAEAAKQGLTPQQFAEKLRAQAMAQQQQAAQQQQQAGQPGPSTNQGDSQQADQQQQGGQVGVQQGRAGQQIPITPGPPKPEALAVAKFLRGQNLKTRACIFEEKRRELFKVKRAIRALQSPAYEKARKKEPLLPAVTDRVTAENTFKLLPISMLALRVSKLDPNNNPPHGSPGHQHGQTKKVKGLWTVKIEPQQECNDYFHYMWFYEGSNIMQKVYAGLALAAVVTIVLFPLWPMKLRLGVWYLSMGCLGLLGAFFGLAIFRLILFLITIVTTPPGIWLYPNLFEDVGFFDSFRPVWAWRETKESLAIKKAEKKAKRQAKREKRQQNGSAKPAKSATGPGNEAISQPVPTPTTGKDSYASGASTGAAGSATERRPMKATVEEAGDDE